MIHPFTKMIKRLLLFILLLCSAVSVIEAQLFQTIRSIVAPRNTKSRSFHVIGLGHLVKNDSMVPVDMGVEIMGEEDDETSSKVFTMQSEESSLLYHVDIDQDQDQLTYRYVMLEKETHSILASEPFHRTLTTASTLNEFYGRQTTVYEQEVQTFPVANDALFPKTFDRAPNELHRYNEIVTIHITAPPAEIDNMHSNYTQDIDVEATMTYISSDKVKRFESCSFSVGGRSSRKFTKLPYKLKLAKGDDLGGYRKFKLRTTASDPSYIREKLAYDLHYAVNRPTTGASYVRLFINDKAIGLFLLAEKFDDHWLQKEYNHGEKSDTGALYKTEGALVNEKKYADLSYHPDDQTYYNTLYSLEEKSTVDDNGMDDLISFTQFIDDQLQWQASNSANLDSSVELWEQQLNVKGVLTNLALEFLLGTWDNYIQNAQNYYLYKTDKMDWVAWDFDFVLGNGPVKMEKLLVGDYQAFDGMTTRPLTKALLAIPTYRHLFESQVRFINQHLLAPKVSFPVIDSLIVFLKQDILWDQALPRVRAGRSFKSMMGHIPGQADTEGLMSVPLDFDVATGFDFLIRVNANVSLNEAVEGPSKHKSLMAIKDYVKQKVDNVNAAMDE